MYPRTEYEMTEEDLQKLLDASKPTPCMMIGSYSPPSPQENSNRAWDNLGLKMGFDSSTVRPIFGKSNRHFSAVPSETETQKEERTKKEKEENRLLEIKKITDEIIVRQNRINLLEKEG